MACFGTTDFDNSSQLITLSAIIMSGLHCTNIPVYLKWKGTAHIYKMSARGTEGQEVMGGLEKLCDEELQKCVCRLDSAGLV